MRKAQSGTRISLPTPPGSENFFSTLHLALQEGRPAREMDELADTLAGHQAIRQLSERAALQTTPKAYQDPELRQDLSQGALLDLHIKLRGGLLKRFDTTRARPNQVRGWLSTILLNSCRNVYRRLLREGRAEANSEAVEAVPARSGAGEARLRLADRLHKAVHALPMKEEVREVLLDLLAGERQTAIAARLGRSDAWVHRKKEEGLVVLREFLVREEEM